MGRRSFRGGHWLGGVLAVAAVASTAAAQQQPGPGFTLQVNTQLVVLDVVVTDKKGENVHHLSKDDFIVYEDKQPQAVRSFEEVTPPAPGKTVAIHSTEALDRLEPQAPVSVLVIDELTTKFEDLAFANYSLRQYLRSQGDTLEQPTLLLSVSANHITVLQDYTTSRQEILDALDRHRADFANLLTKGQNASFATENIAAAFGSLINVAQATAGHPGHKNMIWIGRGLPTIDRAVMPPDVLEQFDAELAMCSRRLRDSRVTLYAIDPAGLPPAPPVVDPDVTSDPAGDDPFGGQVDFDQIAEATGGRGLHGRNDVDAQIGATVRDGEDFYTLAYRPAGAPNGAGNTARPYRSIRVAMKNPELTATTRTGYFTAAAAVDAARDATTGKPSDQLLFDVNSAAASLLVYDGVPLQITRSATQPNTFHLRVRAADLAAAPNASGQATSELTLLTQSFDRKGKILKRTAEKIKVAVAPPPALGLDTRAVDIPVTLATAPPAARIRFVVRTSGNGKVGAENYFLVNPKTLDDPAMGTKPGKK